ncbi:MAG TPA: hypothetical protein VMZ25_00475 [Terriglobales bacterium]|nr:hypothetical protein [Terriglobales bacterium]
MRPHTILSLAVWVALSSVTFAQPKSSNARAPKIDPNLKTLADTERAFARLGAEKGIRESFLAYFAEDGIWFTPTPKRTVEELSSRPAPTSPPQRRLEWAPMYGDVSQAGDLGYDTGPSANSDLTAKKEPTRYGYFFSIWKKQSDGSWRVALDLGTQTPDAWDPGKPPEFRQAPPSGWKSKRSGQVHSDLETMKAAEAYFSQASQMIGLSQASADFLDEAARVHRNGVSPLVGRDDIQTYLRKNDTKAHWEQINAFIAKSADLGYTYGRYTSPEETANDAAYYVHVWRKNKRGEWKLVFHVDTISRSQN